MPAIRAFAGAHFGGLPSRFWWIWVGAFVSSLATFVFLFLAVYLTARGFEPRRVGLILSCLGLGSLVAGPLGGTLADRIGRRPTLLGALLATAAFAVFLGLVRSPALVVVGVLGFGLCSTAARPALIAALADVVPEADRSRAFGLLYWANNVGVSVSAVVGGAVGEHSWLGLFLADAATTLVYAAVIWRRVPETGRQATPQGAGGGGAPGRGWGTVLGDRAFVGFLLVFVAFVVVFFQFQVAAPIAMTQSGLGPARIGQVLAVNGLLIAALQPFAGRVVAGRDPGRVLAAGALLVGGGYGAYALCRTVPQWAAATALWTLGEIVSLPVAVALVSRMAPADLRGRYNGAYAMAFGVGQTLAPAAGGGVLDRAGAGALFGGCLAACAAVAVGHLALGASRRGRAALEPAPAGDEPPPYGS